MKKCFLILGAVLMTLNSCKQKLEKKQAEDIIKEEISYPKPLLKGIYINDPDEYSRLIEKGLGTQIDTTRAITLADMGKQVIYFKDSTYLVLPRKEVDVQLVKVGIEDFSHIEDIKFTDDGLTAKVFYTTKASMPTPFACLIDSVYFHKETELVVNIIRQGDRWILKK